jgi:hypothetical protein
MPDDISIGSGTLRDQAGAPLPAAHESQVGDEKDDGGKSAGVQAIHQPGNQHRQRAEGAKALDDAPRGVPLISRPIGQPSLYDKTLGKGAEWRRLK